MVTVLGGVERFLIGLPHYTPSEAFPNLSRWCAAGSPGKETMPVEALRMPSPLKTVLKSPAMKEAVERNAKEAKEAENIAGEVVETPALAQGSLHSACDKQRRKIIGPEPLAAVEASPLVLVITLLPGE